MSLADSDTELDVDEETNNFWFVGQKFFKASTVIASELADWFQDPAIVSEWLVSQQQRMVLQQPLVSVILSSQYWFKVFLMDMICRL